MFWVCCPSNVERRPWLQRRRHHRRRRRRGLRRRRQVVRLPLLCLDVLEGVGVGGVEEVGWDSLGRGLRRRLRRLRAVVVVGRWMLMKVPAVAALVPVRLRVVAAAEQRRIRTLLGRCWLEEEASEQGGEGDW